MSVYSGRMILSITGQLFGLFLPIFLYQLFNFNITWVLVYYIFQDLAYFLMLPFACRLFMNRLGLKDSLRLAVILGSVYYLTFYFVFNYFSVEVYNFQAVVWMLSILGANIVILTLFRSSYWVPLHTEMAKLTNKENRGKQLSLVAITQVVIGALMPLVAGWILNNYNYGVLFLIGAFVYVFALFPFSKLPRIKENFSWSYKKTINEFKSKEKRKIIIAYAGDGAENVVGLIVWPIFIWQLLEGNYFEVGVLSSIIVVITIGLQMFAGKRIDKSDKNKMLKYGSALYAMGWIFKIFIATAFQIFITSTYHSTVKVLARTSFDAINYEIAADNGHYVDEYTVIREMSILLGKMLMAVLVIILTSKLTLEWSFVLAALAALTMNFLSGVGDKEEEGRISNKILKQKKI